MTRCQGTCLAWDLDPAQIGNYITFFGGGNFLHQSAVAANVLQPNWWAWQQGGTLYIHCAGTDLIASNGAHLWADITGYFLIEDSSTPDLAWQSYFYDAANAMYAWIAGQIAAPDVGPITTVSFSGHSYGGAVVQIAAWYVKQKIAGVNVECLTFGSPKPAFIYANGPGLSESYQLANAGAPVPCMPPQAQIVNWSGQSVPALSWFGVIVRSWYQLGRIFLLSPTNADEYFRQSSYWNYPPLLPNLVAHSLTSYRANVIGLRRIQLMLNAADATEIFVLGQDVGTAPVDPGLPPAQRNPPDTATVNVQALGSQSPALPLTQNSVGNIITIGTTASFGAGTFSRDMGIQVQTYYKFTFFITDTVLGDSMSFVFNSATVLSMAQIETVATTLMNPLAGCLSNGIGANNLTASPGNAWFGGVRVSQMGVKNGAVPLLPPFYNNATLFTPPWSLQSAGLSQQFNSGLNLRLLGTATINLVLYSDVTNCWIPSVPDGVVTGDKYVPQGVTAPSGGNMALGYDSFLQSFVGTLINPPLTVRRLGQWGHFGVNPTYVRPQLTLFAYAGTPITQFSATCSNITGYNLGDIVQIMTANARGWNGLYRIAAIAPGTGTVGVITFNKPPNPGYPLPTQAQMRPYRQLVPITGSAPVFFAYSDPGARGNNAYLSVKPAVRKPSRPFSTVSFRHHSRLPRTPR